MYRKIFLVCVSIATGALAGCAGDLPLLGQATEEPIVQKQTVPALLPPARKDAVYLPAEPVPVPQNGQEP